VGVGLCVHASGKFFFMHSVWCQASSTSLTTGASISAVVTFLTLVALLTLASVSASQILWVKCGGIQSCVQVYNCF